MTVYPPVPAPPMELSAPHGPSVAFLVICSVTFAGAIIMTLIGARRGDPLGILLLISGLLAGCLEPMLDQLGLLWFAENNVAVAVTSFHRFVPLYVVMGYSFFFGAQTYIAYRGMLAGRPASWFWKLFAFSWVLDFALQATGRALGLYQYYGPQPFLILGVPAWWFTIDAALPPLAALALFRLHSYLHGWRWLVVIPLVPAVYAGINAAAGWPVFSVLNSGVSPVVTWLGGAATIGLALLFHSLTLGRIADSQAAHSITRPARTAPDQPLDPASGEVSSVA